MAALLTNNEMSLWTQSSLDEILEDPFAKEVNEKVGDYLCFLAGHPEWTIATAPYDVKVIALWMFKRTYTNPDQEVATGVGPLTSRVLDEAALAMNLTASERATLEGYKASSPSGAGTGLFLMSLAGRSPRMPETVYLPDNQQVNLGDTLSWDIPFTDPMDVNHP